MEDSFIPKKNYLGQINEAFISAELKQNMNDDEAHGLARGLSKIFRKLATDERLNYESIEAKLGGVKVGEGGGGGYPLLVGTGADSFPPGAAIDAGTLAAAAEVLTGTADEVTINAYIQKYGGVILHGLFIINGAITTAATLDTTAALGGEVAVGTHILGQGAFLYGTGSLTVSTECVVDGVTISGLANTVEGGGEIRNSMIANGSTSVSGTIRNCKMQSGTGVTLGYPGRAVACSLSTATLQNQTRLVDCTSSGLITVSGSDAGLSGGDLHSVTATGWVFRAAGARIGTLTSSSSDAVYTGCHIATLDVTSSGVRQQFVGCAIDTFTNADIATYTGCTIAASALGSGRYYECSFAHSNPTAVSPIMVGCEFGSLTVSGRAKISQCTFSDELILDGNESVVHNCDFRAGYSGANVITINGGENRVQDCTLNPGSGYSYGITVTAASQIGGNIVVGNNLFQTSDSFGVAAIQDLGVGTKLNLDGGAGNWNFI